MMGNNVMAWTFPAGKIPDNYSTVNVATGNALTAQKKTVPAGKQWLLFCGSMRHNDSVLHVMTIELYDENDKLINVLLADGGGAGANGVVNFPTDVVLTSCENGLDSGAFPLVMKAGWYVQFSAATVMTDASVKWEFNMVALEVAVSE
jgi:hypothetical protein